MADYQDILKRAIQIRDAVLEGTNTASLVGGVMVDTLYQTNKLNDAINKIIESIKYIGGSSSSGGGSIDEKTLAAYLISNGYAKKADIPISWWGQSADENNVVQGELSNVLSILFSGETDAIDGVANDFTPSTNKTKIVTPSFLGDKYVPRKEDSEVLGTLTFEKIQKFLQGLQLGTFSNMSGGDWSMDEEGRSHLITDYLEVRMKAFFEELVIKKTSTIGGKELISPAGSNVISDVEEVTVTYDGVSQTAYRCYFLAEQDGEKIDNDWVVGDQARSESFNVKAGTYHKVGNHFFWRLVIGCNDTDKPVEREGKKYHYIDISSLDYATASDVPMKGDVVNQCGNRTDITRQNCLVLSAVDTYSPSITLYHGISSYSFSNKEYVEYGVVKSTGKAFFNVYGDAYIGDRPTSANNYEGDSYIKYDSEKKKVVIKAELSIGSTVGDKTLDKYIEGKTMSEEQVNNLINNSQVISDLQNQIDGAIETWFYDGVPTLSNAPASDWKTDAVKNIHLGDLYYDNKTGKAYRFALDGSTYKWTVITDTDITKALSDAAKAQETADGKMTVFSSQPTPPYQTGDIWVNATYGTTYKNDVLRCKTAKGEGKSFDIADWMLASKYTDDTVAKEAKAAAELAQENIKTTQENLKTLGGTVTENKNAFDKFTEDGYLDSSEIAAMAQDSKRLEDAFTAAEKTYNEVKDSKSLLDESGNDTKYKTDLVNAYNDLVVKKKSLLTYLSDIVTRYNDADSDGKAAINAAVANEYSNFQTSYTTFYNALGVANNYIISNLYDGLDTSITNIAGLDYIKAALVDGKPTDIKKGLILSTLIALRNADGEITSGINGADTKEDGIALWLGGKMVDRLASTTTDKEKETAAKSLLRFDGSGYFANGAIWWGTDGKLHADPTSFIINENNIGVYLSLFEPTWKSGSDGTDVKDIASLTPCAPFNGLSVAGNVNVEGGYVKIGGAYLVYKDGALMMSADKDGNSALNVFATGGISAYGASGGTGGGGLSGSIIPYATAINMTTSDESTEVASAWSIKKLSDRIKEVSSAIPSISVEVPTTGNAITGASYDEVTGKLSFTKGTFLTSHQSLSAYLKSEEAAKTYAPVSHTHTKANITDMPTDLGDFTNTAGFTKNKGTVTSVKLTAPTGFTVTNGTVTTSGTIALGFATGYSLPSDATQKKWTSAYDWYKLMTTDEEEADGVINKWNEVVSFLANISQTDTLSGIVDGINTSITDEVTRAKKAEKANADNITANANSITTLKGYFDANGNAKKALQLTNARKLWGNSFNGTSDINGNITMQSTDGTYIQIGGVRLVYDEKNTALKVVKSDGTTAANLYATGGVSAYGSSSISGAGGGLNGNVLSYESAKALTSNSDETTQIASAWSIKKLYDEISSLDLSGSAKTAISATTSGNGNAITSASYDSETGKFTFTKGSTFSLSSHTHNYLSKLTVGTKEYTVTNNGITIPAYPTTLPASDVSAWAKASTKPTYTASEVGAAASSHTHTWASITNKLVAVNEFNFVNAGYSGDIYFNHAPQDDRTQTATINKYHFKNGQGAYTLILASGFVKKNGSSSQFLKADGSVDSNSYLTTSAKAADSDKLDGYHETYFFRGRGEIGVAYADLKVYDKGAENYKNPDNGIYTVQRTGYSEALIAFTNYNNGSSSGLDLIFHYSRGGKLAIRRRIDSNRLSGDWESLITSVNIGSQSVASAAKLATARNINGTSFNGTADITTAKWGTARNVGIVNSDGTGTAVTVSVDGSAAVNLKLPSTIKASLTGNADTATKLKTARTLWGQSFDGSANVSGLLTLAGGNHGALKMDTAYLSGLGGNIVMQNTTALRFSTSDSWDYNVWAGLKYDHSAKTIYLGLADGTVFHANTAQSGGTLSLPGIQKVTLGGVTLEYDSTNKALKVNGSLYATGGITAYGEGSSSGSGGLNGSVYEYSKAILETSDSTTKIASAYSIAKLKSLIDSISVTGEISATISGNGNALTAVSYNKGVFTFTKGSTFLTSHQTLDHLISKDTRNTNNTPTTFNAGIYPEFKTNSTDGLSDGGTYHGILHWRSYGNSTDTSGGFPMQIAYTANGRLWTRIATSNTKWGDWKKIAQVSDITWSNLTSKPTTLSGFGISDGVNSVSVSGSGNAVTSASISNHTLTLTKGSTFLTSHQSLSAYMKTADANAKFLPLTGNAVTASKLVDRINDSDSITLYSAKRSDNSFIRAIYDNSYNILVKGLKVWSTDDYYDVITKKDIGSQSVNYATTAGNAKASDVYSWAKASTKPSYSWSEIGSRPTKLSQFTNDSGFITSSASISGNAGSATKLRTARTLWGRSFDGTANVSGYLQSDSIRVGTNFNTYTFTCLENGRLEFPLASNSGTADKTRFYLGWRGGSEAISISNNGYIGIGDTNPGYKLSVNGTAYIQDTLRVMSQSRNGLFLVGSSLDFIIREYATNKFSIGGIGKNTFCFDMANGYIGIGDTNPGYSLEVPTIRAKEKVYVVCYNGMNGQTYNEALNVGGNILASGGITAYSSSDLRLKSNLHKADSLRLIKSLGTVYEFDYKRTKEHSFGLIAQNVQKSRLSDLVGKDEEGYLKLNYWSPKLISLALGGIVQVDDKVTKLKRKVKALEKEVKSLRDELNNKKEDKDNININA